MRLIVDAKSFPMPTVSSTNNLTDNSDLNFS
jgi:hypothetical protein